MRWSAASTSLSYHYTTEWDYRNSSDSGFTRYNVLDGRFGGSIIYVTDNINGSFVEDQSTTVYPYTLQPVGQVETIDIGTINDRHPSYIVYSDGTYLQDMAVTYSVTMKKKWKGWPVGIPVRISMNATVVTSTNLVKDWSAKFDLGSMFASVVSIGAIRYTSSVHGKRAVGMFVGLLKPFVENKLSLYWTVTTRHEHKPDDMFDGYSMQAGFVLSFLSEEVIISPKQLDVHPAPLLESETPTRRVSSIKKLLTCFGAQTP